MKGVILVALLCATGAFSFSLKTKLVKPKLHPQHPVFAPKHLNPKIVGGNEAQAHSIPHQAALFLDGYFCGASLIDNRHVLTAAHCCELTNKPQVVLGAHKIREQEDTQVTAIGSKVTIHPDWDSQTLLNDICIIELPQEVELNENIQTIQTAPASSGDFAGETATASGWGKDSDEATSISPVLRVVQTKVLTNEDCQEQYGNNIPVESTHVCIDGSDGKSTCNGDSGGPLTVKSGNKPVQIGLTSFGVSIGCEAGYPAAFTRVSKYNSFIQSNTQ